MIGRAHDHGLDNAVADQPAIPVLVLGHALTARGDHERRIGHDAVEPFPRDRVVQASRPELDVPDPVQRRVQSSDLEGPLRDVGGDHLVGVPGRVHGLDAAAGAQVEHALHRGLDHQAAERHRRPADAEHVLLGQRLTEGEFPEVGDDPPLAGSESIREAVRSQIEQGPKLGAAGRSAGNQAELACPGNAQSGQCAGECCLFDREPEHEQPRERARGRVLSGQGARGRHPLTAQQGGLGLFSPQRPQRLDTEGCGGQVGPEAINKGLHRSIQPCLFNRA